VSSNQHYTGDDRQHDEYAAAKHEQQLFNQQFDDSTLLRTFVSENFGRIDAKRRILMRLFSFALPLLLIQGNGFVDHFVPNTTLLSQYCLGL